MANILVIDDNETIREGVAAVVAKMGHKAHVAEDGQRGVKLFKSRRVDFTITDLKMEGMDGIEVLKAVLETDPDAVVMLITAFGTVETAVEAMKSGAFDFITKPFKPDLLRAKVDQALEVVRMKKEAARLKEENRVLREENQAQAGIENLVGESPAMQEVFTTVRKVAPSDSTVLVTGESGTGKELIAHALHDLSRRREGPFIRVGCGALAETLLESEMFGHEKGAFTGASRRKLGRFELADGGTIFLDEIGEIGPALQMKLLRVLQEREFERVGGEETLSVDVRVVAATNRDLEALVQEGVFREDLYYRLHIVPLRMPALRERPGDVARLARHFIEKLSGRTGKKINDLTPGALEVLEQYRWPGNVRELENVIQRAMVLCAHTQLRPENLPLEVRLGIPGLKAAPTAETWEELKELKRRLQEESVEEAERMFVLHALEQHDWNATKAAEAVGMLRPNLQALMKRHGIRRPQKAL
jgi:two-component system response regulator HydG